MNAESVRLYKEHSTPELDPRVNRPPSSCERLPAWAKNRVSRLSRGDALKRRLRRSGLVTVCEEARCPNLGECFERGTATFMLLGDRCTRSCRFCSVAAGRPQPVDPGEAERVAAEAARLGLRYVVLTSVCRDDLADGGAGAFAAAIAAVRRRLPGAGVEVLTPDFGGREESIAAVVEAQPDVFAHNLETVERLTPLVRSRAQYRRSLQVLAEARRRLDSQGGGLVKSGLMVGLGETRTELRTALRHLREAGCDLVTVGQYLRPTRRQRAVARYLAPREFEEIEQEARDLGFREVACGPLVRSSYRAESLYSAAGAAR